MSHPPSQLSMRIARQKRGAGAKPFVKLSDPAAYVACTWDLVADGASRIYWVEFFKRHLLTILKVAVDAAAARGESIVSAQKRAAECRDEYYAHFDAFAADPSLFGGVTILTLDAWRDYFLLRHGFPYPFVDVKGRENQRMLELLPQVCRQADDTEPSQRAEALLRGLLAGNIYDMGAEATAKKFLGEPPDFFAVRAGLKPRPWLIDDLDRLLQRLAAGENYRKAVFFADNAGSDFVLGVLPLVRRLALRGTRVVLAVNQRPSLNDMTLGDLHALWPLVCGAEASFGSLPIECVHTGTGEPLIDLSAVSDELNDAAADADLVILEGMGRGVESNLEARFSCDVLNIAMLKDAVIAKQIGGELFDVVCRFRPSA